MPTPRREPPSGSDRRSSRSRARRRCRAVSVGVASFPDHGEEKDALLAHADEALYAAKRAGRNRVAVYETEDEIAPRPRSRSARPTSGSVRRLRSGIRLLVVDDQPNLRMLLRTTFEIIDVEVDEAGSAAEAMQRWRSRRRT